MLTTLSMSVLLVAVGCQVPVAPGGALAPSDSKGSPLRAQDSRAIEGQTIDLSRHFEGVEGCFVLRDVATGETLRYEPDRCAKRFPPCSTFKVPNAMIGLETGVITGPDHWMKWDGIERSIRSWNQDQDLRSATKNSAVWYFQNMARSVGPQRMTEALAALDYGNQDISGGIDRFWLGASLEISADEQVRFFQRLSLNELPFSPRSQSIARDLIIESKEPGNVLRGKTGSGYLEGQVRLGWFVGLLSRGERTWAFATRIEGGEGTWGGTARKITHAVFSDLELQGLIDRAPGIQES